MGRGRGRGRWGLGAAAAAAVAAAAALGGSLGFLQPSEGEQSQETMSMLSSADDARYTAVEIVHESRPNGLEYHNVEIEGMKPGGFLDGWIELSASTPPPAPLFPAFVPPTALLSRGHPPPGITISRDRH